MAVKAGNGLGKGFCAAVALLWFIHAHREAAIALSTAPTFRQVRHILWRQLHRLYRPVAETLGGKMLDTRWELSDDCYAMGLSADSADQFQGLHSPNIFIVVHEAEVVSDEIFEAIESVMTSADPLLLLIGNPTTMNGAFRRAFFEERQIYSTITISALDSPNVRAGRVVLSAVSMAVRKHSCPAKACESCSAETMVCSQTRHACQSPQSPAGYFPGVRIRIPMVAALPSPCAAIGLNMAGDGEQRPPISL